MRVFDRTDTPDSVPAVDMGIEGAVRLSNASWTGWWADPNTLEPWGIARAMMRRSTLGWARRPGRMPSRTPARSISGCEARFLPARGA